MSLNLHYFRTVVLEVNLRNLERLQDIYSAREDH